MKRKLMSLVRLQTYSQVDLDMYRRYEQRNTDEDTRRYEQRNTDEDNYMGGLDTKSTPIITKTAPGVSFMLFCLLKRLIITSDFIPV